MIPAGLLIMALAASCSKNDNTIMPFKDGGNSTSKNSGMGLQFLGTNAPTKLTTSDKFSNQSGSSAVSTGNASSPAGTFTFSEALLVIRDIDIKRMDQSFDDSVSNNDTLNRKYDFNGNYLLNLLNGTSTPALNLVNFIAGTYNKVEAKSAKIVDGNNSISLKGTFADTTAKKTYTFDFSTVASLEFKFVSDTGFYLDQGKVLTLLVNINLPDLFAGVDFSKATMDSNNVIVINETSNTNLMAKIITNIRHMANGENSEAENEGGDQDSGRDNPGNHGQSGSHIG